MGDMQTTNSHTLRDAGYLAAAALALGGLAVGTAVLLSNTVFDGAGSAPTAAAQRIAPRWMRPARPHRLANWKAPVMLRPAPTRVVWVSQPAGTTAPVIAAAPAAPRTDEPSDDGGHEGGGDE